MAKSNPKPSLSTLCKLSQAESIHTWHQPLGHVSFKNLKKMQASDMVQGLYIKKAEAEDDLFCEGCIYGKHRRLPFPSGGRTRATRIGGLIHSDLVGPMLIPSVRGSKYFLVFKDDHSCYSQIHFIKKKSETADLFNQYAQRMEVVTGNQINTLRTENGGEYFGNDFEDWLKRKGIRHESSMPKTPEQNGVAERVNRTIIESARSMLHSSGLPTELWAEACSCAVYLQNRMAVKGVDGKTPYEVWNGVKPNLSHLRIFGSDVFLLIPRDERGKFDPKPIKCQHVG
jgi:hypothetical protein